MKIYAVKVLDISEEKIEKLCLLIDLEKKHKIEKFINKKDKLRALIGEILIRTIICERLNIKNKHIKFDKNKYGKPYLKEYQKLSFNISHSGDFVVFAIDNKSVGIDIEKIEYIEYEKIAKSFFTASEFDYITQNDSIIDLCKFYEIWTLKESYIKCCGQGLSMPLKSFSIERDKYDNIKVISDHEYNVYKFAVLNMDLNYKIAVCSLNKEIPKNLTVIDQCNLINSYLNLCIE